jgi:hypothetical protein
MEPVWTLTRPDAPGLYLWRRNAQGKSWLRMVFFDPTGLLITAGLEPYDQWVPLDQLDEYGSEWALSPDDPTVAAAVDGILKAGAYYPDAYAAWNHFRTLKPTPQKP